MKDVHIHDESISLDDSARLCSLENSRRPFTLAGDKPTSSPTDSHTPARHQDREATIALCKGTRVAYKINDSSSRSSSSLAMCVTITLRMRPPSSACSAHLLPANISKHTLCETYLHRPSSFVIQNASSKVRENMQKHMSVVHLRTTPRESRVQQRLSNLVQT
jgi:hypothetical protein